MTDKKAIAQKLLQINAIKLSVNPPFTWASGWKSPIYCDNRRILSYPFIRETVKSELCNIVFTEFPETEMIAGVATAGIPWGAMVADQLKLPYIYVRPEPKKHGMGNQIEGFAEAGKRVVVMEDLVSTGKSSMKVIQALKNDGLLVEGLVSIFNYGFLVAENMFKNENIPVISLTDYDSLVAEAIAHNYISADNQNALLNWRSDPENWTGNI